MERSILEMLKHRKISSSSNEKSEHEIQKDTMPNLNYKLWKQRMEIKNNMYKVPFNKYENYQTKLNSMKDGGSVENKYIKNDTNKPREAIVNGMNNNQQLKAKKLDPTERNKKNENLSNTAITIIGLHLMGGFYLINSKSDFPDRD